MKIINYFILISLIIGTQSCSKIDKSIATQWWSNNKETAIQIVKTLEQDADIDAVDVNDDDKFESETYRKLVSLLMKAKLKKVTALRGENGNSAIKNVRFVIDSSGISTDGCGLTVEYVNSDNYLSNLRSHVAYIEQIDGKPHWFIAIYGNKDGCVNN